MIPIQGPRVRLRDFRLEDLSAYRAWRLPGHAWQALDGPYYAAESVAEIDATIDRLRQRILAGRRPSPRSRLLIADAATDRLVGTVSWYWIGQESWWPAAGISLFDEGRWRQGLGFEALGLWVDYLFRAEPRFRRVDAETWSGNAGMMRLAEKLGFTLEARHRKARRVGGLDYDSLGYGVLREEWIARYPRGFAARLREAAPVQDPPAAPAPPGSSPASTAPPTPAIPPPSAPPTPIQPRKDKP